MLLAAGAELPGRIEQGRSGRSVQTLPIRRGARDPALQLERRRVRLAAAARDRAQANSIWYSRVAIALARAQRA